jgi:ABC-type anion transport system duplicated permease subunit
MRKTMRMFAALLVLLLVYFSAGWYALRLGSESPVPWAMLSVWGDMITVGMVVEQALGYVPNDGQSLTHAALVISSAAILWALLFTLTVVGVAWCVRIARKTAPTHA